ncbi:MAG: hypothetical protein ACRDBG_08025 [Waterburya sp.]
MVIQNVQLRSINGSNFQLLSVEPPLLQGDAGIKLVDLDDVDISTTTNNWVVAWNSTQNKFILAPPSNVSTNFITVNSNLSDTLNFGAGFNTQTITGVTSISLDANLDLLGDVNISIPTIGDRLVFNGSQWVNSPSSSGSNTVTVNSSPDISTLVFSNQFGVNVVGNVANISFNQTFDLESLTDVDLNAPLQGQLLRYTGTQWENSTLDFNPADFTVLNTVNATGIDIVPKSIEWLTNVNTSAPNQGQLLRYTGTQWENSTLDFNPADFTVLNTVSNTAINLEAKTLDWLSDVTIVNTQPNNYLSYNGTEWVNTSFNIGQSQAAGGSYFLYDNNVPTTNLFLDVNSFNYGVLPSENGWFLDFKGLSFSTVNGIESGYAQSLEFPLEFIFSSSSFNDGNLPTPDNLAKLGWRSEAKPLSRFVQILNTTDSGQILAHNHYGGDCSGGFLNLFLNDTPNNGDSVSITDVTPLMSAFNGIRLNVTLTSGNKIDTSQVDFWDVNRGETKTFTFSSIDSTWHVTDKNGSSGGGITDGDKGDISVSNSGATWTIDNDIVTFSKIQNVSTGVLLGRSTSGNGDVETINIGSGLNLSGGTLNSTGETGQSIVTKLESLTGTDKLNASAIDGFGFGSSQTNLVEEIVVTTPVSSISFNPDNLVFGEDYQMTLYGLTSVLTRVDLRVNGDLTNTGYQVQFLSINNATITAGRETDSNGVISPASLTIPSTSFVTFTTLGGNFRWSASDQRDNSSLILITNWWGRKVATISNFTGLTLFARSANFSTGFTARLYRLNNSTNLVNRPVQTANFTALRNSIYPIDSSAAPVTATLDITANWRIGDRITFFDDVGTISNSTNTGFSLNPFTIQANSGQNISGSSSDTLTIDCQSRTLIYRGSGRFIVA